MQKGNFCACSKPFKRTSMTNDPAQNYKSFQRCIRSNVLHRAQSFQKRKWTCIPSSRYSDSTQVLYDYGPKYFRSCLIISMSQLYTKLTLLAIHICITLGYSIHWCHNHRTIHPNHEMQFPFLDNIPNI